MHGARAGAPKGERNGNYRHGAHTNEARALTAQIRLLNATSRDMLSDLLSGLSVGD
jgi:hypothetical protein